MFIFGDHRCKVNQVHSKRQSEGGEGSIYIYEGCLLLCLSFDTEMILKKEKYSSGDNQWELQVSLVSVFPGTLNSSCYISQEQNTQPS